MHGKHAFYHREFLRVFNRSESGVLFRETAKPSNDDPRKHTKMELVVFVRFRVSSWIVPVPAEESTNPN